MLREEIWEYANPMCTPPVAGGMIKEQTVELIREHLIFLLR
jgi:hypothetical protein